MPEDKNELKKKLLIKKEWELEDLDNSQLIHIENAQKVCSEEMDNTWQRVYGII